jgi:hypothetical protein
MGPGQEIIEAVISAMWSTQTEFEETISKRVEGIHEVLDAEFQWSQFDTQVMKTPIDTTLTEVQENWKIRIIMRY